MSVSRVPRAVALLLSVSVFAAGAVQAADLGSDDARYSYTLGFQIAQQLKLKGLQVDPAAFAAAIEDGLAERKPQLTIEQMQAAVDLARQQELAKEQAIADANTRAGSDFRAAYAKQDGVQALDDGVLYKVIKAGDGALPTAGDTVVVNYRGTLIDGTEFDSSYARNAPASFKVSRVIPGFSAALQKMPVGAKWEVVIPGDQAYGARGIPDGPIGPNETLIFELELVEIKG